MHDYSPMNPAGRGKLLSDRSRAFRLVERINTGGTLIRRNLGPLGIIGRTVNFSCARGFDLFTFAMLAVRRLFVHSDISDIARREVLGLSSGHDRADALCRYVFGKVAYARSMAWLSPADVLWLGYGDCKCHARLLHALLEAVGIQARVVIGIVGRNTHAPAVHSWIQVRLDDGTFICDATMSPHLLSPAEFAGRMGGALDVTPEYAEIRPDGPVPAARG